METGYRIETPRVGKQLVGQHALQNKNVRCNLTHDYSLLIVDVWMLTSDQLTPFLAPASPPKQHFSGHCGPVCCVERSPFFRDILLSVGGWTFALWKEGAQVSERGGRLRIRNSAGCHTWHTSVSCVKHCVTLMHLRSSISYFMETLYHSLSLTQSDALMKSCSSSVPLTGGAWSPTRPGRKRVE